MDAKKLLKQYDSLNKEIRELEKDIQRLSERQYQRETDSVKGSNPYFPYEPRNFTITGYPIVDTTRKEKILIERKNRCEELKIKIEEFISTIPDSLTRRVFRYRYIDNLSWQAIAMRIGKVHESYPRRDIHDKYLEGLEDERKKVY